MVGIGDGGEVMRVAAAQAASVWLDPQATTAKVIALIEQAARQGATLLAFPETFLSGYPFWVMLGGGGRFGDPAHAHAYAAYLEAAVELDGPEVRQVAQAAQDLQPIKLWQHPIQDNQRRLFLSIRLQRTHAITGMQNAIAICFKLAHNDLGQVVCILN